MKKHIKDFLNHLVKETPITIDFSTIKPTGKLFYTPNDPIDIDTIVIDGKMALCVYSCGCENCKNITGMQIFYGHSSELNDAETAMNYIKTVAPIIRVELIDELWLLRKPER
jgi:hypothetical protein